MYVFEARTLYVMLTIPRKQNLHPFLASLLNVLYDKAHYKIALSQLNTARHLIVNVSEGPPQMKESIAHSSDRLAKITLVYSNSATVCSVVNSSRRPPSVEWQPLCDDKKIL